MGKCSYNHLVAVEPTMNTAELDEYELAGLDYAVAEALGLLNENNFIYHHDKGYSCSLSLWKPKNKGEPREPSRWVEYSPSTNWEQGGKLIEEHEVWLTTSNVFDAELGRWSASIKGKISTIHEGDTPLIAVCKAIIAAKGRGLMSTDHDSFLDDNEYPNVPTNKSTTAPDNAMGDDRYIFVTDQGVEYKVMDKPIEPLYTPRQVVNMIEAKGLLIHNTGKDHPSIQFWPSAEEVLELLKK